MHNNNKHFTLKNLYKHHKEFPLFRIHMAQEAKLFSWTRNGKNKIPINLPISSNKRLNISSLRLPKQADKLLKCLQRIKKRPMEN